MANKRWDYTVSFDGFWNLDIPAEEKGKLAAKELEKLVHFFEDDYKLGQLIDEFKYTEGDGTEEFTPEDDFNARMSDLYDWADDNRIWISINF